jgi:hypothetical protein
MPPVDFFRLPYPNDIRVTNGTTLDISDFPTHGVSPNGVDIAKLYKDALTADFDGFSASSAVTFRFSADIDFSTVSANTAIMDVTTGGSPGLGINFLHAQTLYSCGDRLTFVPKEGAPFTPGHTYILLVKTGLHSKTGDTPTQDPDLVAVLASTRPTSDAALQHAWDVFAPVRTNFTAAQIASATVFTVANMAGHMTRLANAIAGIAAPAITLEEVCGVSGSSTCDTIDAAHACPAAANPDFKEIHGHITMPIYQTGTEPYATSSDGGNIVENGAGVPQKVTDEQVCFALTVPSGGSGPFKLLVYGHGTGGNMRDFINNGIADKLANNAGVHIAALSFDAVEHGARRGTSTANPEDLFFNVLNPRAARDNVLQGAADILTALKIANITLSGQGFTFDNTRPMFFGHSQGSTSGELALPYWPANPGATVLSGAGASLTASLQYKTSPADYGAALTFLVGEPVDGSHPLMTLIQNFYDRADPVNYVSHIAQNSPTQPKHVFMTWGTGDTYTPTETLEANAITMGIPAHTPLLEDQPNLPNTIPGTVSGNLGGKTAVMFQYAPPSGVDGHFVATQTTTAVDNWNTFVQTFVSTGTPTVP